MSAADTPTTHTVTTGPAYRERTVERFMAEVPTSSGLYLAPDGYTHIDLQIRGDLDDGVIIEGGEAWKILGLAGTFTRRQVAELCHGPYSWQKMYELSDVVDEVRVAAEALEMSIEDVVHHIDATGTFPER